MAIEIRVDHELCQGAGQCVFIAPSVFALQDNGQSVVVDPEGAPEDVVLKAARFCPNLAISVVIDGTEVEA